MESEVLKFSFLLCWSTCFSGRQVSGRCSLELRAGIKQWVGNKAVGLDLEERGRKDEDPTVSLRAFMTGVC